MASVMYAEVEQFQHMLWLSPKVKGCNNLTMKYTNISDSLKITAKECMPTFPFGLPTEMQGQQPTFCLHQGDPRHREPKEF
jgi:hypothetical protein